MFALIDAPNSYLRYKHQLGPVQAAAKAVARSKAFLAHVRARWQLAAFDSREPSFRYRLDARYKGGWAGVDTAASPNLPYHEAGRDAYHRAGFCVVEVPTYEADDLIASFVARVAAAPVRSGARSETAILSTDTDLFALASAADTPYVYGHDGEFEARTPEAVTAAYGVPPDALEHLKAVVGEEGIPGVKGLGKVKAARLLLAQGLGGLAPEQFAAYSHAYEVLRLRREVPLPVLSAVQLLAGPLWR